MKKKVLTEKEYFKYNSNDVYDALDRPLKIGDTVVINNNYRAIPIVGVIDHYLNNGKLAICYNYYKSTMKIMAYRHPSTVIKLKSINKNVINHIFNK